MFIEGFYIGYRVVSSLEPFTYKTMNIFHATNGHGPIVHPTMASDDGQSSLSLPHWTLPSEFSSKNLQNTLIQSSYLGSVEGKQSSRTFEYIVDSLRKGTKYSVIIQAFNSKGAGPSTNEMTIETFANGTLRHSLSLSLSVCRVLELSIHKFLLQLHPLKGQMSPVTNLTELWTVE